MTALHSRPDLFERRAWFVLAGWFTLWGVLAIALDRPAGALFFTALLWYSVWKARR